MLQVNEKLLVRWQEEYFHKISFDFTYYICISLLFVAILQLKDMTVVELKYYLGAHDLPVSGKKEALISRILTHMGK